METIRYKAEDINIILKALNSITIKGAENARYIAFIDEKLRTDHLQDEQAGKNVEIKEEE